MNRFYLIVPVVLVAVFGGIYWQHTREVAHQAVEKQAESARALEAEQSRKTAAEQKAREDADRRTAAQLAEEQKKETEKQALWDSESRALAADIATYQDQLARSTTELDQLNARLATVRATREKRAAQAFELTRAVELDRIRKRNAELEVQRLTEILATQAAGSVLASSPASAGQPTL